MTTYIIFSIFAEMIFTALQIAEIIDGKVDGDPSIKVSKLSKIENGKKGSLTFLSNPKYTPFIYSTNASVTIVNESFIPEQDITTTLIRVKNAYDSFSQLLDYYEEGTWTPTIGLGVSSPTYTKQEGSYVKVGNMVLVSCTLAISSGSTNGSTFRIDGFPFTAFNLTDVAFINCVKPNSVAQFGADVIVYINSNATTAFLNINDATSALGFTGNYFGSSGSISFSLIYRST